VKIAFSFHVHDVHPDCFGNKFQSHYPVLSRPHRFISGNSTCLSGLPFQIAAQTAFGLVANFFF